MLPPKLPLFQRILQPQSIEPGKLPHVSRPRQRRTPANPSLSRLPQPIVLERRKLNSPSILLSAISGRSFHRVRRYLPRKHHSTLISKVSLDHTSGQALLFQVCLCSPRRPLQRSNSVAFNSARLLQITTNAQPSRHTIFCISTSGPTSKLQMMHNLNGSQSLPARPPRWWSVEEHPPIIIRAASRTLLRLEALKDRVSTDLAWA